MPGFGDWLGAKTCCCCCCCTQQPDTHTIYKRKEGVLTTAAAFLASLSASAFICVSGLREVGGRTRNGVSTKNDGAV